MFRDRTEAGRRLAPLLAHCAGPDTVVVGLPRGGVPVAAEVARALGAPLDVIVVRKLGVPGRPELGMGAIGEDDVRVVDPFIVRMAGVSDADLAEVEARERVELARRAERFRGGRRRIPLAGRTVVVVDDGIATGSTARAACAVARAEGARRVVLAVPVAPHDWTRRLEGAADELVCVATPDPFYAVGEFYDDFRQTSDDEVLALLHAADARGGPGADGPGDGDRGERRPRDEEVEVDVGDALVGGHLGVPPAGRGLVVFAHGSGSSRFSPRNRYVAERLQGAGLATLLFDLLTPREESDRGNVFDIDLLGRRLRAVESWARGVPGLGSEPVGFFGASTGAGAALWAAADPGCGVRAVVSRGGRPDLAGPRLHLVRAPTLLIVGGHDVAVLGMNREAQARMRCETDLAVVPGATHLFEEPGTLTSAADLARDWFLRYLADGSPVAPAGDG
ncbi:MAG: phosphoribosyltransferase [Candidatus Nanopelagicales bacterium]